MVFNNLKGLSTLLYFKHLGSPAGMLEQINLKLVDNSSWIVVQLLLLVDILISNEV